MVSDRSRRRRLRALVRRRRHTEADVSAHVLNATDVASDKCRDREASRRDGTSHKRIICIIQCRTLG